MIRKKNKGNIIFIPARRGSSRILNKNLQKINSLTLIEIAIKKALNLSFGESKIILSTDYLTQELNLHEELLNQISIHKRSASVSNNNSSTESTLEELLNDKEFIDFQKSDGYILMLQVTSPLLDVYSIQKGINLFLSSKSESTTVFSAYKYKQFTWKEINGNFEPVSYNPEKRINTQDMQEYFQETGGFYLFPIKGFLKSKNRFMKKRIPQVINHIESLDIDEAEDLAAARKHLSL